MDNKRCQSPWNFPNNRVNFRALQGSIKSTKIYEFRIVNADYISVYVLTAWGRILPG